MTELDALVVEYRELNQFEDRCDRCGSEAKVRTVLGLLELLFCSHHFNAFEPKLVSDGFLIQDDRAH